MSVFTSKKSEQWFAPCEDGPATEPADLARLRIRLHDRLSGLLHDDHLGTGSVLVVVAGVCRVPVAVVDVVEVVAVRHRGVTAAVPVDMVVLLGDCVLA